MAVRVAGAAEGQGRGGGGLVTARDAAEVGVQEAGAACVRGVAVWESRG